MIVTIIEPTANDELTSFIRREAGDRVAAIELATIDRLDADVRTEPGIVVLGDRDPQLLAECLGRIERFRTASGRVGRVLLVPPTSPHAATVPSSPDDEVLVLGSPDAAVRFRRFVAGQRLMAEARYVKPFVESASDGFMRWDVRRDRITWSDRMRKMALLHPRDVPHTLAEFRDRVHPDDLRSFEDVVRFDNGGESTFRHFDFRLRSTSGAYRTFRANGEIVRDGASRARVVVCAVTDVTVQTRNERLLESQRDLYGMLFHFLNDAVVLADTETGMIVAANEPAGVLWRRAQDELVGMHQSELHPPMLTAEAREAFARHVEQLQRDNRATLDFPIITGDGEEVPTEISSSLIELDGRSMLIAVFRDITDRVQATNAIRERDAQLQLSSRLAAMGTLAAGVGHEINNPLTYVVGNLAFIEEELANDTTIDRDVVAAVRESIAGAHQVRNIVSDLKALARADDGGMDCDPAEVVRVAARIATADIRHRATVTLDVGPTRRAAISSSRLSQVLLNVLTNASHSLDGDDPTYNRVTVRVRAVDDMVEIRCDDNGSGIAPETLAMAFEPFFTTKPEGVGTGLGLAICHRLLSEVGGTIHLESEVGVGTSAVVHVPVSTSEISIPAVVELTRPDRPRVLVIDDDEMIGRAMRRMLQRDFEIEVHRDPAVGAHRAIHGGDFDAVLCDLMMPGLDGEEVYKMVAEKRPAMAEKMIFVTGGAVTASSAQFETDMRAAGRLLIKPVSNREITEKIDAIAGTAPRNPATSST